MMVAACKMLLATSLLLGLAVNLSNAADTSRVPGQTECQLPSGVLQTPSAISTLASLNNLCPIGVDNPSQGSVCLPCVCGALELFNDALAKSTSLNRRSGASSPLGVPETADQLNTCVHAHSTKFLEPLKVKAGLSECLSAKGLFADSAKLQAMCNTWSTQFDNSEVVVEAYESDDSSITLSTVEAGSNTFEHAAQNHRMMQEEDSSGETSGQFGGYGGVYPPPYPPGVYGSPAPPYGGGGGGIIIGSPSPDAFTPPSPDAYTPPSPDAYTPPSPDAYTPPSPDAYTPPSPGGEGAPPSPGEAIIGEPPNAIGIPPFGIPPLNLPFPPPAAAGLTSASLMSLAVAVLCAFLMGALVM